MDDHQKQAHTAAISMMKGSARSLGPLIVGPGICPMHAPLALLANTYLIMCQEAGMDTLEAIARLHSVARHIDGTPSPEQKVH